jgi:glycosyltransferase involved in cell wall biosynthesis
MNDGDAPLGDGRSVTILLPHYQCRELLLHAIESLRAQTFTDWQLAVVDDASLSNEELAPLRHKTRDERIVWLRTSQNVGPYRIYNRLLPSVASPFVVLQDADDVSYPSRLETLVSNARKHGFDVLGSGVRRVSPASEFLGEVCPPHDVNRALRVRRRGGIVIGPTLILRTEFLRSLGGFDGSTRIGGDTDLACRAVFAGRVANLDSILYEQTVRDGSLTGSVHTGFGSAARQAYRRTLRRRFYANLLRSWTGLLRSEHLVAPCNDIEFEVSRCDGGSSA